MKHSSERMALSQRSSVGEQRKLGDKAEESEEVVSGVSEAVIAHESGRESGTGITHDDGTRTGRGNANENEHESRDRDGLLRHEQVPTIQTEPARPASPSRSVTTEAGRVQIRHRHWHRHSKSQTLLPPISIETIHETPGSSLSPTSSLRPAELLRHHRSADRLGRPADGSRDSAAAAVTPATPPGSNLGLQMRLSPVAQARQGGGPAHDRLALADSAPHLTSSPSAWSLPATAAGPSAASRCGSPTAAAAAVLAATGKPPPPPPSPSPLPPPPGPRPGGAVVTAVAGAVPASPSSPVSPTTPTSPQGHPHAHPAPTSAAQHSVASHAHTLLRRPSFLLPGGYELSRRHSKAQHSQGLFEPTLPSVTGSVPRNPSPPPVGSIGVASAAAPPVGALAPAAPISPSQVRSPSMIAAKTAFQQKQSDGQQLAVTPGPSTPTGTTSTPPPPLSTLRRLSSFNFSSRDSAIATKTLVSTQQHQQQPPAQPTPPAQPQHTARHLLATAAASLAFPRRSISAVSLAASNDMTASSKTVKVDKDKTKMKLFSKPKHMVLRDKDKDRDRDRDRTVEVSKPVPSPSHLAATNGSGFRHAASAALDDSRDGRSPHAQLADLSFRNGSSTSVNTVVPIQERQYSMDPDREYLTAGSVSSLAPISQVKDKDKESKHKHHFLSRPKLKLKDKDEHYNLPLSSAASNSMPMDPNAPQSLYSFAPSSPSNMAFAKTLDLRHGGRSWREKKKEEKDRHNADAAHKREAQDRTGLGSQVADAGAQWYTSSNATSQGHIGSGQGLYGTDVSLKDTIPGFGLHDMAPEDAWDFLKAKLLVLFEGEFIRVALEDLNRLVSIHLQCCVQARRPGSVIDDVRELLQTGFESLSHSLGEMQEDCFATRDRDRAMPRLSQIWTLVFGTVLPFLQAVFLPLDVEFKGHGRILPSQQAREIWAAKTADLTDISRRPPSAPANPVTPGTKSSIDTDRLSVTPNLPTGDELTIRSLVLIYFRDVVILSRYDALLSTFSRLSLDSMNDSVRIAGTSTHHMRRPSTASVFEAGYVKYGGAQSANPRPDRHRVAGDTPLAPRARTASMISFTRDAPSLLKPDIGGYGVARDPALIANGPNANATSTSTSLRANAAAAQAGYAAETIAMITATAARMLQCMSVLASVHTDDQAQGRIEELGRALKHNWLGRARTGRDRRGFVGAKTGAARYKPPMSRLNSEGDAAVFDDDTYSPARATYSQRQPVPENDVNDATVDAHPERTSSPTSPLPPLPPQQNRRNSQLVGVPLRTSTESQRSGRPSFQRLRSHIAKDGTPHG
ncbi:hypothetical protein KEM52_004009 [Ascosphaera acerosa]|nr:hypothetical protein KEM52_004009 [Ascosphaera acerosa]